MSNLTLDHVVKRYGDVSVVKDVSLAIAEGEFVSLLGPSGCGKTTILRMVAGLITPSGGSIRIGAREVTGLPPNKRNIGLVFQSYALFPHLTVFENVAFGLRRKGEVGEALKGRVTEALAMVRLAGFGERYPRQLSGGQQQRVAMARAIAPRPSVLLFDEPLSNLDAKLRDEMQIELKRLQRELGITTLFVTHDQAEALSLSDRVCVMHDGVIQQFAPPEEIYRRPATAFVASFIGKPNRMKGTVRDGAVLLGDDLRLRTDGKAGAEGADVDIFIRQEAVSLTPSGDPDANRIPGSVALRSFSGAQVQYVVRIAGGHEIVVEAASSGPASRLAQGDQVTLEVHPGDVLVLAEPPQSRDTRP
ncbi:ABC transporter ATP-binding protein [Mesorhizobium sp. L-8-10]|uniref:ABC transporter ATP-binding protein n=1 Tax=Mesorhizobium sp. L-8-10 TaxID=2744523 RepID=UPI0019288702|nr:ABC transporter ATP-binding protein [Mesorhizobium sp. L-8-10]BCH29119.1 ABC transporter ATP-binding protein [Mesorhizobium sp. L-8-10]